MIGRKGSTSYRFSWSTSFRSLLEKKKVSINLISLSKTLTTSHGVELLTNFLKWLV